MELGAGKYRLLVMKTRLRFNTLHKLALVYHQESLTSPQSTSDSSSVMTSLICS